MDVFAPVPNVIEAYALTQLSLSSPSHSLCLLPDGSSGGGTLTLAADDLELPPGLSSLGRPRTPLPDGVPLSVMADPADMEHGEEMYGCSSLLQTHLESLAFEYRRE